MAKQATSSIASVDAMFGPESGQPTGQQDYFVKTVTIENGQFPVSETFKTNAFGTTEEKSLYTQTQNITTGELTAAAYGDGLNIIEVEKLENRNSNLWSAIDAQKAENYASLGFGTSVSLDPNAEAIAAATAAPTEPIFTDNDRPVGAPLVYPETRPPNMDYLKITPLKYEPGGLGTEGDKFNVGSASKKSTTAVGNPVFLPMQPALQDSNSVSWGQDSLNPIQVRGARIASTAIQTIGGSGDVFGAAKQVIGDAVNAFKDVISDPNTGPYMRGYFAGEAVGANVQGRITGTVLNNNLELLFNGPSLRTFNYTYKFTPRSASEASIVKEIIRQFKIEMAVKRDAVGLFLKTPNVFKLEYIFGSTSDPHPFMNQIKTCALTSMNVDYAPDGTYMTYADGSMTSYTLNLQFAELDPIYRDDQEKSTGMGY